MPIARTKPVQHNLSSSSLMLSSLLGIAQLRCTYVALHQPPMYQVAPHKGGAMSSSHASHAALSSAYLAG